MKVLGFVKSGGPEATPTPSPTITVTKIPLVHAYACCNSDGKPEPHSYTDGRPYCAEEANLNTNSCGHGDGGAYAHSYSYTDGYPYCAEGATPHTNS